MLSTENMIVLMPGTKKKGESAIVAVLHTLSLWDKILDTHNLKEKRIILSNSCSPLLAGSKVGWHGGRAWVEVSCSYYGSQRQRMKGTMKERSMPPQVICSATCLF